MSYFAASPKPLGQVLFLSVILAVSFARRSAEAQEALADDSFRSEPQTEAPGAPGRAAEAGTERVHSEVTIVAGNTASARTRALEQALLFAVRQRWDRLVFQSGLAGNPDAAVAEALARYRSGLLARASRFVDSYRIAAEGRHASRYSVEAEVDVDGASLARELSRIQGLSSAARPTSKILLRSAIESDADVVSVLAERLEEKGFRVERMDANDPSFSSTPDDPSVAVQFFAPAHRVGTIWGTPALSVGCELSLVVSRAGFADRTLKSAAWGVATDERRTVRCFLSALRKIEATLVETFAQAGERAQGDHIDVITHSTSPAVSSWLLKTLGGVDTVQSAKLRTISKTSATVRVQPGGRPEALAERLMSRGEGAFELIRVEDGVIELHQSGNLQ